MQREWKALKSVSFCICTEESDVCPLELTMTNALSACRNHCSPDKSVCVLVVEQKTGWVLILQCLMSGPMGPGTSWPQPEWSPYQPGRCMVHLFHKTLQGDQIHCAMNATSESVKSEITFHQGFNLFNFDSFERWVLFTFSLGDIKHYSFYCHINRLSLLRQGGG